MPPPQPEFPGKRFVRDADTDEVIWVVQEVDAVRVPGSRGRRCLVFESPEAFRRLWIYPGNWSTLPEEALRRLAERSPSAEAHLEAMDSALARAIGSTARQLERTMALLATLRELAEVNRAERDRLRDLLERCRDDRTLMRSAVQAYARELRRGGILANDAAFLVKETLRARVERSTSITSEAELERNADRWCAAVYASAA